VAEGSGEITEGQGHGKAHPRQGAPDLESVRFRFQLHQAFPNSVPHIQLAKRKAGNRLEYVALLGPDTKSPVLLHGPKGKLLQTEIVTRIENASGQNHLETPLGTFTFPPFELRGPVSRRQGAGFGAQIEYFQLVAPTRARLLRLGVVRPEPPAEPAVAEPSAPEAATTDNPH
jgi:hypothetical protein